MTSLRRKCALAVATVAVATPLLSSCGFNYATDRPNTIANGGYHIEGDIHVMAARIIAPAEGSGTFVASITLDPSSDPNAADADEPVTLTGLSGDGLTVGTVAPVEIQRQGIANLFTDGGIPVSGDFAAGDSVPVTLTFDDGESIDVNAVVVTQCHEYADVETQPSNKASGKPGKRSSASASPSASPTGESYSCDYASVPPMGEGH